MSSPGREPQQKANKDPVPCCRRPTRSRRRSAFQNGKQAEYPKVNSIRANGVDSMKCRSARACTGSRLAQGRNPSPSVLASLVPCATAGCFAQCQRQAASARSGARHHPNIPSGLDERKSDSSVRNRPASVPKGHASVKMLYRKGLSYWPAGDCFDPLPHRQLCPPLPEVKYSVFPSGDQLA